jgi:hypothetical protein
MTRRLKAQPLGLSKAMFFKVPKSSSMLKKKVSMNARSSLLMRPPQSPQVASLASALRMGRNTALQKLSRVNAAHSLAPMDVVSC